MKKALSLILALMLCVSILALPALADDYGEITIEDDNSSYSLRFAAAKVLPEITVEVTDEIAAQFFGNTMVYRPISVKAGSQVTVGIRVESPSGNWITAYSMDSIEEIADDYTNGDHSSTHSVELPTGTYSVDTLFTTLFKGSDGVLLSEPVKAFVCRGGIIINGGFDDAVCIITLDGEASTTPAPAKPVVQVSPQKVTLDGAAVEPEHYNIDGDNYFKLRDLASLLNGTSAQFEVGYNDATKTISVTTGKAYTPNGDEMLVGVDQSASAVVSAQKLEINGTAQSLTAYNIGGNNFFRLRDLDELLGYGVDYDAATNTAIITSK